MLRNKVYLIVSKWGYPFGGGEEFLYQTMDFANKIGLDPYWLCFSNGKNEAFQEISIEGHQYGSIIKIPGGFEDDNIYTQCCNWIKILNPIVIHHQGHLRKIFYKIARDNKIEFMTGFHFWGGAIILDPIIKNVDILENYEKHKPDPEIMELWGKPYINYYAVTEFVSECIKKVTGYEITDNIYASSSENKCLVEGMNILENKYVSIINIHKLKGGEILLHLLKTLKNIPFLLVCTEYNSEELDKQIFEEIKKRGSTDAQCLILERQKDPKIIYQQTRVLLAPSLCDETFCRVVNEGMMNGIPIMTTGQGNIKYLVKDNGYIIKKDNLKEWETTLKALYNSDKLLMEYSEKSKLGYVEYSEKKSRKMFTSLIRKITNKSKELNIMILAPWCDQGLGIQSRNYVRILETTKYNTFIFAIKPYNANCCTELQKNKEEWNFEYVQNRVYYSKHDREHITDGELLNFVSKYNIGKCIIPETCWFRIFEMAKLLQNNNVKTFAIPNIEIVRKDEIFKHAFFHKILCNNHQCENIFNSFGITNTEYIGYGIKNNKILTKNKKLKKSDPVYFLFIGGMNAFSRKHILDICEAFVISATKNKNIFLTCTIQKTNMLETDIKQKIEKYFDHPNITFIQSHLSYQKILDLYSESHVSIQVSKHEGLGLGFYEAIGTVTPVISLNTPPHNEIIKDNTNGWLIPCYYKQMTDNTDPLFDSAYFDPNDLSSCISKITNDVEIINKMFNTLISDFNSRLHYNIFRKKFIRALTI